MPGASKLTPERVRQICEQLAAEQDALKTFSVSLEQEFLDLGSMLRKISSLSRELQQQSDDVRSVTVGAPLGCPMEFAFKLLNKAEGLARINHDQYAQTVSALDRFRKDLASIARNRDALLGTLARIHLSHERFRIEAAYLDATKRTQLFALVDAGSEILKTLQTKVALRFEELGGLLCTICTLTARFTENIQVRAKSTEESLLSDHENLNALNDALLRSQGFASINLRGRLNIAGGVRKAMVALQCQDITRQKIEHINSGVQEIVNHLTPGVSRKLTPEEEADCKHYLSDAAKVQLAQLRATFDQLFDAARQVKESLDQVSTETQTDTHLSPQSSRNLLENRVFTRGLECLASVFALMEIAKCDWEEVTALTKALKQTFADCTSDLSTLLNQLQAIQGITQTFTGCLTGQSSLKAVIQEQRALLEAAVTRIFDIAPRAQTLVNAIPDLEQQLQKTIDLSSSEWSELDPKTKASTLQLTNIKEQLTAKLLSIRPIEQNLADAVEGAQKRIRFPQAVTAISARSLALFEKIVDDYQTESKSPTQAKPHDKVRELKRHYTMAGEHTIHDESVGSESAIKENVNEGSVTLFDDEPELAAVAFTPESEDSLADNVELF